MINKIKKFFIVIILMIIIICCNKINVYALNTDDMDKYKKNDQFEITKDSYLYTVEFKKNSSVNLKSAERNTDKGIVFKKGSIVKYTGNFGSNVTFFWTKTTYYIEVTDGKNKGYVHSDNLKVHKTETPKRPSSITAFISQYGVDKIKTDEDMEKTVNKLKNSTSDKSIVTAINQVVPKIEQASPRQVNGYESREKAKKELASIYKEALEYPYDGNDDVQFMAIGYMTSYYYNGYLSADEQYGKDDGNSDKDTDWKKQYDDACKNYQNAKNDNEKTNAYAIMEKSYKKLTDDEKNEKASGQTKTRKTLFTEIAKSEEERAKEAQDAADEEGGPDTIYQYPTKNEAASGSGLDDMIGDADRFIDSGGDATISSTSLQKFSQTYYNILLTIGIVVATLVGLILGIRFMISGAEGKANVKELLLPYIVGCIVVFGAFAIWKLAVTILSNGLT